MNSQLLRAFLSTLMAGALLLLPQAALAQTVYPNVQRSVLLTSGRIPIAGTGGIVADDADLSFSGDTLTATKFAGALNGTVGATTPAAGAFTTLSASSTVSGTGFSTYLASPPAIGGTAPAAGAFTTGTFTGNVTAPDFILGTSGPSVKSSLAARAPSQGLVFDGTAGATVSGVSTFGKGNFTVSVVYKPNSISTNQGLIGGATNCFALRHSSDNSLYTSKLNAKDHTPVASGFVVGKTYVLTYVRSGTASQFYANGVALGAAGTDNSDYSVASTFIGKVSASADYVNGALSSPLVYNRALSAAEVLALYERGAPDAADYNNAGTTNTNGNWANSGVQAFDTFTPTAAASFIAASAATATCGSTITAVPVGKRVRVAYNVSSYASGTPKLYLAADKDQLLAAALSNVVTLTTTAGVNYAELVSTSATADTLVVEGVGASDFTIESFAVVSSGLLLAPDFSSPFDYQLLDSSGNKADVIVPASGVVPAIPNMSGARSVRAALTWAGSHEAKSVLGQVAIPAKAQITSIVTEADAGSAGDGLTAGSVTTPALFVAANSYTTAKESHTLAAVFPAGTATNDLSIVVDPDTQNYTGTIQITINYILTR